MNSAIETELRTLLDNVNKKLALNMSTKHGLDYDEVYEFLTVSMNEDKSPVSRGRPKKEKKTVTENHKDSTGKPDVNYIIKEIMEKDAELEELSEDEIDGDAGEETSVLASSPKSSKKVEKTEKKEKPKVEKDDEKTKVEKDYEKPKAEKTKAEKAKTEKAEAAEKAKAEKAEAAEKAKAEKAEAAEKAKAEKAQAAEKAKADKAEAAEKAKAEKAEAAEKAKAEKAAAKSATAEKKPKGKGKTEVAVEASAADTDAADEDDDDAGMNVCEHIVDGKTYLREEFGTKLYDPETNEEIGDWDEKNNKIIKA